MRSAWLLIYFLGSVFGSIQRLRTPFGLRSRGISTSTYWRDMGPIVIPVKAMSGRKFNAEISPTIRVRDLKRALFDNLNYRKVFMDHQIRMELVGLRVPFSEIEECEVWQIASLLKSIVLKPVNVLVDPHCSLFDKIETADPRDFVFQQPSDMRVGSPAKLPSPSSKRRPKKPKKNDTSPKK